MRHSHGEGGKKQAAIQQNKKTEHKCDNKSKRPRQPSQELNYENKQRTSLIAMKNYLYHHMLGQASYFMAKERSCLCLTLLDTCISHFHASIALESGYTVRSSHCRISEKGPTIIVIMSALVKCYQGSLVWLITEQNGLCNINGHQRILVW